MRKLNYFTRTAIAALLVTALSNPAFAGVRASINQDTIGLNDTLALQLEVDGSSSQSPPDLEPLASDFQIIGTSQASRTSIVNGVASSTHGWTVTLAPKAEGSFTIPAISVGGDKTDPIAVQVVDSVKLPDHDPATGDVRVEMVAPAGPFYVHQEIPVTVRVIDRAGLREATLSEPAAADAIVTKSGEDQSSRTMQGSQPVTVIEQTYGVKAQKSGTLTLPPITLRGRVSDPNAPRSTGSDPFERLGLAERFSGLGFGGSLFDRFMDQGQPVTVRSAPLTINIKARPGKASGWFLPAKMVELHATWTPENPTFRVGEAVTRTIQLVAVGASEEQLPNLSFSDADGARLYVDRTDDQTVDTDAGTAAMKQVSVSIVPTQSGPITLPAVEVTWWNTTLDEQKTAILAAQTIQVEGAVTGSTAVDPPEPATAEAGQQTTLAADQTNNLPWMLLLATSLLLIAVAVFLARRRWQRTTHANAATAGQVRSQLVPAAELAMLEQDFRKACRAGAAPAAYDNLQRWLAIDKSNATQASTSHAGASELEATVHALEQRLYSRESIEPWDGSALLAAFEEFKSGKCKRRRMRHRSAVIPPLYPITTRHSV